MFLLVTHASALHAGGLSFLGALKNGAGASGLGGAIALAITPDGSYVYVASADDDAVAVFRRDPATGLLAFVDASFNEVNGVSGLVMPKAIALSPDGANVYGGREQRDREESEAG